MYNFKHGDEIFKKLSVVVGLTDDRRTLIAALLDFKLLNTEGLNEVITNPKLDNISKKTWSEIIELSVHIEDQIL